MLREDGRAEFEVCDTSGEAGTWSCRGGRLELDGMTGTYDLQTGLLELEGGGTYARWSEQDRCP